MYANCSTRAQRTHFLNFENVLDNRIKYNFFFTDSIRNEIISFCYFYSNRFWTNRQEFDLGKFVSENLITYKVDGLELDQTGQFSTPK